MSKKNNKDQFEFSFESKPDAGLRLGEIEDSS